MTEGTTAEAVARQAADRLASGVHTDDLLRAKGRVGAALPIVAERDGVAGWFAPVIVDDLIAGYFRADAALGDWRFSSFQRRQGTLDGCPPASLWLDRAEVTRRALAAARSGETAAEPVLSFDGVPDRIAWAVRLFDQEGGSRILFVAGRAVWAASESGP
jgi:hypothetical protein